MLFNKRLLQTHLNNFDYPVGFDFEKVQNILRLWQESIKNGNYDKTKETQVQAKFLTKFFNEILGYQEMQESPAEWYLINEAKTEIDGTKADGALGYFSKNEQITRAVIELKDANTPLDKKQSTRKDYDSPVSQAFSYSSKFDRCDWIIVSNFKEIRLYNKERGQGYFESFEVLNLGDDKEFKKFYFCLCKENLLDKSRNSLLDRLVKDTSKNEEDISNKFYKDFKALRKTLFTHLCENNPDIDKKCVLEKTQKLLDRLVFVMFCEDSTINLLPANTLKNYYEIGKNLPIPSDEKMWSIIKGLFESIDKGNNNVKPPINRYNGGLFAYDNILDNLKIKDSAWEEVIKLANYDFESDLNVNILGHIFEQSLNDLEQIKAEIDGIEQDNKKSKRKKDGIFYTPEYITRYIVEQTIGKYLEENPDKLETIKILDPACGSGAFLNQAHSFLQEQYKIKTEEKINATKALKRGGHEFVKLNLFEHQNLAEVDRSILLNNIYGVDLNSESTEITKLALWLKTAKKDQPLQNLDANIKCGNSLINDPTIAGEKAFNWDEEFKDIMSEGGFDVIIGNPPYGASLSQLEKGYYQTNYNDVIIRTLNTYNFFILQASKLLKENGFLSFIVPNTLLYQLEDKKTRELILSLFEIKAIINLGDGIFEDADVPTCIFVLKRKATNSDYNYLACDLRDFECAESEINFNAHFNEVKVSSIFSNEDKQFVANNLSANLLTKLYTNAEKLEKHILTSNYGVTTSKNPVFILDKNTALSFDIEKNVQKEIYEGANISKYFVSYANKIVVLIPACENVDLYPNTKKYLLNHKETLEKRNTDAPYYALHRERTPELFSAEKIIMRQTSDKIIATIDSTSYYCLDSILCIKLQKNINTRFILSLLNSKLFEFLYNAIAQEKGRNFAQVKPNNIKKLPIPNTTPEQQQNLASKVEQMMELNKQLHDGIDSALELIQTEYQPKKISQNLEKFYTLGIHPFIEELEKQKIKLSLTQKEELIIWYKEKSDKLNKIKQQIDALNNEIDQEVYKLYNLTDEEIKIIENN
ncbi:MAG: hypothetical protein E7Z87_08465 [Cyanobacteria bacterium SIG26]|nr:hypothetical protein [Cyanobacteria bacterium SIG26]